MLLRRERRFLRRPESPWETPDSRPDLRLRCLTLEHRPDSVQTLAITAVLRTRRVSARGIPCSGREGHESPDQAVSACNEIAYAVPPGFASRRSEPAYVPKCAIWAHIGSRDCVKSSIHGSRTLCGRACAFHLERAKPSPPHVDTCPRGTVIAPDVACHSGTKGRIGGPRPRSVVRKAARAKRQLGGFGFPHPAQPAHSAIRRIAARATDGWRKPIAHYVAGGALVAHVRRPGGTSYRFGDAIRSRIMAASIRPLSRSSSPCMLSWKRRTRSCSRR
jgi:hypothetical protein